MKTYTKTDAYGKFYYKDKTCTVLHRTDGPAIEAVGGYKAWWVDGKQLTEEEFKQKMSIEVWK